MAKVIVVHGFPGAGKSTNSARLASEGLVIGSQQLPVVHASAGDRLRAIRLGTGVSEFSAIVNSPEMASPLPDDVVSGTLFELIRAENEPQLALFDGYPRFEQSVDGFIEDIRARRHHLLGCVALSVSLETSVERIMARGRRLGDREDIGSPEALRLHAERRYNDDFSTTRQAIKRLETLGLPVEYMDSSDDRDTVYAKFRAAITRLALKSV